MIFVILNVQELSYSFLSAEDLKSFKNHISSNDLIDNLIGYQTVIYSNGDRYEGQVVNFQLHGYGCYYYINKDIYKGEW